MEHVSKKAVATSKPFKFLIGPNQTEYTIHSALVAHQSAVLSALVNGSFRESSECSVKWDDVDEIVFSSFWQFVYTGDYDTPVPLPPTEGTPSEEEPKSDIPDEPAPGTPEAVPVAEPEAVPEAEVEAEALPSPAIKKKKKKGGAPGIPRISLWFDFLTAWGHYPETFDVDVALKDHANPLVHHAKVYTLADRYAITRLTGLSRTKLHQGLIQLAGQGKAYNEVVELVRYTFEELVPDQLRDLVVHYSACVVEHLWKIEEFQELVGKYGVLSKALVGTMLLRFDESETTGVSYMH
ncbi:hypothetical protein IL306_001772 [Fusarium sp. DS 682]|nr:hypothetical protein IL306_001772 [Fusarium sp. DS 682]